MHRSTAVLASMHMHTSYFLHTTRSMFVPKMQPLQSTIIQPPRNAPAQRLAQASRGPANRIDQDVKGYYGRVQRSIDDECCEEN